MSTHQDLKKAYEFSLKGGLAKITLVMSIVSLIKLSVDFFSLPTTEFLENIIKTYQVVFHTCFDVIFMWVPFVIPYMAKDLAIFYFLFGFIYQKVIFGKIYFDYKHPWIILHNYGNSKIKYFFKSTLLILKSILVWPLAIPTLFKHPYLIVAHGAHGPSAMSFTSTKPDLSKFRGIYYGDSRLMMMFRLTSAVITVCVVLALNYAFSI